MKLKECECESWKLSMPQIDGAQTMVHIHGGEYTGDYFLYCPWCGKKREEIKEEDKIIGENMK